MPLFDRALVRADEAEAVAAAAAAAAAAATDDDRDLIFLSQGEASLIFRGSYP